MGLHLTPAAKAPYYLNEFKWGYNIKSYGYISLKYLKWVISQVYLSRAITIPPRTHHPPTMPSLRPSVGFRPLPSAAAVGKRPGPCRQWRTILRGHGTVDGCEILKTTWKRLETVRQTWNTVNHGAIIMGSGINHLPTGAGFLPSTACLNLSLWNQPAIQCEAPVW